MTLICLQRLRPLSYAQAHVILIAFTLDTPDSLENAQYKWAEEVRRICGSNVPVLLVGCKSDLRDSNVGGPRTCVTREEVSGAHDVNTVCSELTDVLLLQGKEIAAAIGARAYYECSALRNEGVDAVFEAATRAAMLVRPSDAARKGRTKENLGNNGKRRGGQKAQADDVASGCRCIIL